MWFITALKNRQFKLVGAPANIFRCNKFEISRDPFPTRPICKQCYFRANFDSFDRYKGNFLVLRFAIGRSVIYCNFLIRCVIKETQFNYVLISWYIRDFPHETGSNNIN